MSVKDFLMKSSSGDVVNTGEKIICKIVYTHDSSNWCINVPIT